MAGYIFDVEERVVSSGDSFFFFFSIFNVYLVTYGPKRRRIGYRTGTTSQATCIASSLPVVKYGANWLPDLVPGIMSHIVAGQIFIISFQVKLFLRRDIFRVFYPIIKFMDDGIFSCLKDATSLFFME